MTWGLSDTLRNARITLVKNAIDGGPASGLLRFYNGTKPAVGAAITTQLLQCTIAFADPCGTVTGPTLTFDALGAVTGTRIDDKTITWARIVDSTGAFVADAVVSVGGGGGDVIVNSVTGAIGSFLAFVSGSLTEP
jgi:hypothetical protein